jgi:hypothetical protein
MTDDGMARFVGVVFLVPGLALLGFGAWTLKEMMDTGVYSFRMLLCCGLIGGGLTLTGIGKLLGGHDENE